VHLYIDGFDDTHKLFTSVAASDKSLTITKGGSSPTYNCGSNGALTGLTNGAYEFRIGQNFPGRFNDFIVWNEAKDALSTMHVEKIWASIPTAAVGYAFDDAEDEQVTTSESSFNLKDTTDEQNGNQITLNPGVFRGLVYGAEHRWRNCPGIDWALSPESVCSNTAWQERGRCFIEDEENPLSQERTHKCQCNEGFVGYACQIGCPGEVWVTDEASGEDTIVPCNNRGTCHTVDAENTAECECSEGYAGAACENLCPGWIEPPLPGQQECNGNGVCEEKWARDEQGNVNKNLPSEAICKCSATSGYYGLACEYRQNALPMRDCSECSLAGESCQDHVCVCEFPYYEVGQFCQSAQEGAASTLAPHALLSIIVALLCAYFTQQL